MIDSSMIVSAVGLKSFLIIPRSRFGHVNILGLGRENNIKPDDNAAGLNGIHPINEILHWHNAIKRELNEILEAAKKAQHFSGNKHCFFEGENTV